MKRNLRGIPSSFIALCANIHPHHASHHLNHHLRFLSQHHSITSNSRKFKIPNSILSVPGPSIHASFTSGPEEPPNSDAESDSDDEFVGAGDPGSTRDLETIIAILRTPGAHEKSKNLDRCGVAPTPGLVTNVLSGTRNDWESAFTFFLWAGKHPDYSHSLRDYHSMIAILGKARKFDTAWSLIDEMRPLSLVTPHTLLIMMRKHAAVHDVAKAISAFYALRRFKFEITIDEFQGLLSSLSRYKNVKDAEHLLFCNSSVFPLNTKSFNIILNGWCNVIGSLREGKRIWKEMETRGIRHDVYSYASILSCLSKANRLNVVLRLYEKMKAVGIKPDRKVYNAVIHALAKGKLVKEARRVMKAMEEEDGIVPDSVTYNSLIKPLCKSRLLGDAQKVFDEMTERGLTPTVRTYHAFLRALRTGDEVFELLERMRGAGCEPGHDTYIMLIRKFCRWQQVDLVFRVWNEMKENRLDPDRSSYIVLIHGLFLNGKLEEAHRYYVEMKEKGLLPEAKIDAMLQAWVEGKTDPEQQVIAANENRSSRWEPREKVTITSKQNQREARDFRRQPEMRCVTREKGFSFYDR